jgi:GAF domain-containing protein
MQPTLDSKSLEAARSELIEKLHIFGEEEDPLLHEAASAAANICKSEIGLVKVLGHDFQWHKGRHGFAVEATPKQGSFCRHTVKGKKPLVVTDATLDKRFKRSPLVTGPEGVRFYLGVPRCVFGIPLGAVCAMDRFPREAEPEQIMALTSLTEILGSAMRLQLVERTAIANKREPQQVLKYFHDLQSFLGPVTTKAWQDAA